MLFNRIRYLIASAAIASPGLAYAGDDMAVQAYFNQAPEEYQKEVQQESQQRQISEYQNQFSTYNTNPLSRLVGTDTYIEPVINHGAPEVRVTYTFE